MIALFIAAVQDLIIGGGAETQDNEAQGARKPDESWQPVDAQAIQSMNINQKTDLNVKVLCDCNYEVESEDKTIDSLDLDYEGWWSEYKYIQGVPKKM